MNTKRMSKFVSVCKPTGSIRLCLDPTHLNKYVVRSYHKSKTLDDILSKLAESGYLFIVDSTKSFFNLGLTPENPVLTTFGTMFGCYCYLRVLIGVSLSSDVYQYKIDKVFSNIHQSIGIVDDIAIYP